MSVSRSQLSSPVVGRCPKVKRANEEKETQSASADVGVVSRVLVVRV